VKQRDCLRLSGAFSACTTMSAQDMPAVLGQLDSDTAVCRDSFKAALAAAGACCAAVDDVLSGKVGMSVIAGVTGGWRGRPTSRGEEEAGRWGHLGWPVVLVEG
jgi:acetoin utilization deacetylase AcuC-like enzyme